MHYPLHCDCHVHPEDYLEQAGVLQLRRQPLCLSSVDDKTAEIYGTLNEKSPMMNTTC